MFAAAARKGEGRNYYLADKEQKQSVSRVRTSPQAWRELDNYLHDAGSRSTILSRTNKHFSGKNRHTRDATWQMEEEEKKTSRRRASQHSILDEGRGAEPPGQGRGSWTVGTPESSLNRRGQGVPAPG